MLTTKSYTITIKALLGNSYGSIFTLIRLGYNKKASLVAPRRLRAGTLSMAERSYHTSEVRGSGLECQAATVQERQEELPSVRGQEWPGGATHARGQGQ